MQAGVCNLSLGMREKRYIKFMFLYKVCRNIVTADARKGPGFHFIFLLNIIIKFFSFSCFIHMKMHEEIMQICSQEANLYMLLLPWHLLNVPSHPSSYECF
ncbi:hypothetical protein QVD17_04683 [Tagetes erecta]|uniref:Uncharacterized protein n=1 Tax=Tagetes erecta TaxID=13708 RepID=A0AAD8PAV4_TARER|nr:hypothetical protein QVD17_04683 [Tagetes erecta]